MIRYAATALVLVAACSAGAATQQQTPAQAKQEEKLAKALDGLTPGKPTSCLARDRVTTVKIYNDTILYVQGRDKVWRNDTNGGCGRRDDIIVSRSTMGQYCRGDLIETRDRAGGHFTGACALGDFIPYSK